jgi:1-acyl-sn-glycerol-3-phosphate acyltransferase
VNAVPALKSWSHFLEVHGLALFSRYWHGFHRLGPSPLPRRGPALLIANHTCHADAAFLIAACGRPLCFFQARERYDILLLRHVFRLAGCIPVRRDRPDVGAIRTALQHLRQNRAVCLFPEGEIAPDGWDRIACGKPGAALLALRSRAPVHAARIWGGPRSRRLLTSWLHPSREVRVRIGAAVDLSAYYDRPINRKLLSVVTGRLMQNLIDLEDDETPSPTGTLPRTLRRHMHGASE